MKEIFYGPHPNQRLLLDPREGRPVVAFIHGGSWSGGSPDDYASYVPTAIRLLGGRPALIGYRKFPDVTFPDFVTDAAHAVRTLTEHSERIFLVGHSAGAHLAAMLAVAPEHLAQVDLKPDVLTGVIGLAGSYKSPFIGEPWEQIFPRNGTPDRFRPAEVIEDTSVPMLLAHGTRDGTVDPRESQVFASEYAQAGGDVELYLSPWATHVTIMAAMTPLGVGNATARRIRRFLR